MERGGRAAKIKNTSIPAKAGISSRASGNFRESGNHNVAYRRMRLSPQRFPLSREWGEGRESVVELIFYF